MAKLLNVLIVEDSPEDAELVMLELRRSGYEPRYHRVDNAPAMSAALEAGPWDVILCDYSMPRLTVTRALALAHQHDLDLPFVIVSGNIVDEEAVAAMRAGAHDFVMKDRLARLAPAIEREVREAEMRRERRLLDERLRLSQKLESLGLLAGGVAHDFNNLLTGILANASMVRDSLPSAHPDRPPLDQVVMAAERAAHLTRQLLAYSGRGRFIVEPVDISALVRDISTLLRSSLPAKVELVLDLAEDLPPVEADSGQVQQLIMNLIINGGEAIGDRPGKVRVSTGLRQVEQDLILRTPGADEVTPGKYVCLEVHDDGCGIEESIRQKIFDPFFSTKFTGRGLGLAAVLGIVRGHRGMITVESESGSGSIFCVLLPAAQGQAVQHKPPASVAKAAAAGTILVIDDEQIVRQTAELTLSRLGYQVLLAEGGEAACELFARVGSQIDMVLLDMTMPVMDGERTLVELRKMRPDVRVLLSSGYDETEAARRFRGHNLAGFIQKPYTASRLAEMVAGIIRPAAGAAGHGLAMN